METIFIHPNQIYSLVLPDGWGYRNQGSQVVLSQLDREVGAVVLSCMGPPPGTKPDPVQLIMGLMTKLPPDQKQAKIVRLPHADFEEFYTEYTAQGDAWRIWVFAKKDKMLFISYNYPPDVENEEKDAVESIVSSVCLT